MVVKAPTLHTGLAIVDRTGAPTAQFQRDWQALGAIAGQGGVAPGTYVKKGQLTGWASPTGATSKATFASYTAPTVSAGYVQAEAQAMADHIEILSRRMAGLIADLKTLQVLSS